MKKLSVVMILAAYAALLAGCNTMEGLGKDVKSLGSKIERKAEEKKN